VEIIHKEKKSSDNDVAKPTAKFGKKLWQEMKGRKSRNYACHSATTTRIEYDIQRWFTEFH
jgi:hypothetical protein